MKLFVRSRPTIRGKPEVFIIDCFCHYMLLTNLSPHFNFNIRTNEGHVGTQGRQLSWLDIRTRGIGDSNYGATSRLGLGPCKWVVA
jgi:hypothetical protein